MTIQPVLKFSVLTQLLKLFFLILALCHADIVFSAPIVLLAKEPELLREFFRQQADSDRHYDLSITPSGSFLSFGQTVYYARGVDLVQGMQSVLEHAGSELTRSTLINAFLQLALLVNPVVPVYGLSMKLVFVYRLQRLLSSWALLSSQLWSWLQNNLSEFLWSERRYEQFNLSSADTGTVILELVTDRNTGHPVELNTYLAQQEKLPDSLLQEQDSGFDGFIRWLQQKEICEWRILWQPDAAKVEHQLFYRHKTGPERFETPYASDIHFTASQPAAIANTVAILDSVFSDSFLQCLIASAGDETSPLVENGKKGWVGGHSGFVPLYCPDSGFCQGLYLVRHPVSGQVVSRRVNLPGHTGFSDILPSVDNDNTALVLGPSNTAVRLPEWVAVLALELLEEIIEAAGYKVATVMAEHFHPEPLTAKPSADLPSSGNRAADLDDDFFKASGRGANDGSSAGDYLISMAEAGDDLDLENLRELARYATNRHRGEAFKVALALGHHRHVEVLYRLMSDDWLKAYIRKLTIQTDLTLLEDLADLLSEKYIHFALTCAIDAGLPDAVKVMRPFGSIPMLTDALYLAVIRGQLDIVKLLVPGKSREVLLFALVRSSQTGFVQVTDYLIDLLDGVIIAIELPFPVLRQSFIRALERKQFERVRLLLDKLPDRRVELLRFVETQDPLVRHLIMTSEDQLAVFRSRISDLMHTGHDSFQLYFKGLSLALKYQLFDHLYRAGNMDLLSELVGILDDNDKLDMILDPGRQTSRSFLPLVIHQAGSVFRDKALLTAVFRKLQPETIKALAEQSSLSSIYRGWVIARNTNNYLAEVLLRRYLPEQGLQRLNYPAYHSTLLQDRETVRTIRNHQLGRTRLGDRYYIYKNGGTAAGRLYLMAHGLQYSVTPLVRHKGYYSLRFIAPDRHNLMINHITQFLEHDFRAVETVIPGAWLKEYQLSKNHNSGQAFNEIASLLMTRDQHLLARKATPFVNAGLRRMLAEDGVDMDILTIRGKQKVFLSHLLATINQDRSLGYREVFLGFCRGVSAVKNSHYYLATPETRSFVRKAPVLFVDTYAQLKLHPALSHTVIWDLYFPNMGDKQKWIEIMSKHQDRAVLEMQRKIARVGDRLEAGR